MNDSDFSKFKSFLNSRDFTFETETEKTLTKVIEHADKEDLGSAIKNDYNALLKSLSKSKNDAIDQNKAQILGLLTDEIVKRHVYREGLYDYYKIHNLEIKEATSILANPSKYRSYLN